MQPFEQDRLGFVTRLAREHGDFAPFRVGPERAVLLSHPDLVEEVLMSPRSRDFSKDYLTALMPPLIRRHLLLGDPDSWLDERHLAQPAFHHDRLRAYAGVMADEAERMAAGWRSGDVLDVAAATRRLTVLILCRSLFDVDLRRQAARSAELIDLVLEEIDERVSRLEHRPLLPSLRDVRLGWGVARLERELNRLIKARRAAANGRADLLTELVRSSPLGRSGKQRIRQVVVPVFFAGHETTAMALAWTLYLLAAHQDAQARVVAELDAAGGSGPLAPDTISRLAFLGAVFTESLRLYPPAWGFGRRAVRPTEVGGYPIPPGTVMWISQWVLHRDGRWFEEPEAFRPERWLDGLQRRLPRCAFIPFGAGSRRCLGSTFANWEAVLCLAAVLRGFEVRLTEDRDVRPRPSLTLRPAGLRLAVFARAGEDRGLRRSS
jgi:cytochrome P450